MKNKMLLILLLIFALPSLCICKGFQVAESLLKQGEADMKEQHYESAIKNFNKVINLNPKAAAAYYDRGLIEYKSEYYVGAIKDFSKTIELDYNVAESYYYRGLSKGKSGDHQNGIEDLNKSGDLGYSQAIDAVRKVIENYREKQLK
ncbi:MAG: tetratricopeptide repeat protein [bacterium]